MLLSMDTTSSLLSSWSTYRGHTKSLRDRSQQAFACARAWERRSTAFARAGQFQEADDATTEATGLYQLAERLENDRRAAVRA